MAILIDFNQVSLNAILAFKDDLKKPPEEVTNLVRHVILSTLLSYKKKYGREYGDLVICCDGRKYWRKEIFQYYKGDRKKSREKSDIDWEKLHPILDVIRADIKTYFPYRLIHLERAEADDVIAILTKWYQTNELIEVGLFSEPQPIMIVSADHDFLQLQKYDNVHQFSPNVKKLLTMSKRDLYEKYITHIVKASDDGIPNILSEDHVLVTDGIRQNSVSAKRLAEFLENGKDACKTDAERKNWERNERLISFEFIPEDVENEIIDAYINIKPKRDSMKMMNYLMNNRCTLLISELGNF